MGVCANVGVGRVTKGVSVSVSVKFLLGVCMCEMCDYKRCKLQTNSPRRKQGCVLLSWPPTSGWSSLSVGYRTGTQSCR